jgi:hypothetical protein
MKSGKRRLAPTELLYRISQPIGRRGERVEFIPCTFLATCKKRRVFPHLLTSLASCGIPVGSREETEMVWKGKGRVQSNSTRGLDSWNMSSSLSFPLKLGTEARSMTSPLFPPPTVALGCSIARSSTNGNAQINERNEAVVATTVRNSRDRTVAVKFPK